LQFTLQLGASALRLLSSPYWVAKSGISQTV
jgi:hypothetical protein